MNANLLKARQRKELRVLIVDDSAAVREAVSRVCLSIPGIQVIGQARDGLEGLTAIRQLKPDVVTLDIRMPKMTGLQVLKALERENAGPIIVVLTSLPADPYRQKCHELGARYFLGKSRDLGSLEKLLLELQVSQ
ncbi:MAG TPA: response regulator [Candidatus Acidoferrum sp.]|nr:response regulator [Candidatus Acidoferrum sp.]